MKRLVLDPNTLVSGVAALKAGSPPAQLIRAMQAMQFEIAICPRGHTCARSAKRFASRIFATECLPPRRAWPSRRIGDVAISFDDPVDVEPILRNPSDDYLVTLAKAAGAEAIVTGNKDLLDHVGLQPPAINPREACELLELID